MSVRRWLFENSLSTFFLMLFAISLVAQSAVGQHAYNEEQTAHDQPPLGWTDYVTSSEFGQAVMENWQSEFLQFTLFIVATIWLVQKGSNESKTLHDTGTGSDRQQKVGDHAPADAPRLAKTHGWRRRLYERRCSSSCSPSSCCRGSPSR